MVINRVNENVIKIEFCSKTKAEIFYTVIYKDKKKAIRHDLLLIKFRNFLEKTVWQKKKIFMMSPEKNNLL